MNLIYNFPQTFKLEPLLLAKLLIKTHECHILHGTMYEISELTGIPTGASSGKVEPTIAYGFSCGLLSAERTQGIWTLELTPLAKAILQEDRMLNEDISLFMMHLMMNRVDPQQPQEGLNAAWFDVCISSKYQISDRFDLDQLEQFVKDKRGDQKYLRGLLRLILTSYDQNNVDVPFYKIPVFQVEQAQTQLVIKRLTAPLEYKFFPAYSAFLFLEWDRLFSSQTQISFDDFLTQTRCNLLMNWSNKHFNRLLDWMAEKGFIQVDRLTGNALILKLVPTNRVLKQFFSELI